MNKPYEFIEQASPGREEAVNSPSHYTQGYIETIYAIAQTLGPEGFKAYCMGNWMKYNARAAYKNGTEDLAKAAVYLNWAQNGLPFPKLIETRPVETAKRKFRPGDCVRNMYSFTKAIIYWLDATGYRTRTPGFIAFADEGSWELCPCDEVAQRRFKEGDVVICEKVADSRTPKQYWRVKQVASSGYVLLHGAKEIVVPFSEEYMWTEII